MNPNRVCEEILKNMIEEIRITPELRYNFKQIEEAIMRVRGIDERTVKRWMKALRVFRYIIPSGVDMYQINQEKIQFTEVLKVLKNQKDKGQLKIG